MRLTIDNYILSLAGEAEGNMSTGTFSVQEMPAKAADLAGRLVYLNAQMHE